MTSSFFPAPLGLPIPVHPKRAGPEILRSLQNLKIPELARVEDAALIRAGALWLHGFLDESHAISQGIGSAEGSYWHALMHRSEPDFSNSKYWYRRVGNHAIFPELRDAVAALDCRSQESRQALKALLQGSNWDPFRFVDLVEQSARNQFSDAQFIQEIAAAEYNLLMKFCLEKARS